jgi:hypothetical protein
MAKLKIHDGTPNETPVLEGYVRVVDALSVRNPQGRLVNFENFVDADPDERPTMLQAWADPNRITQQAPTPNDVISSDNCLIFGEKDRRKGTRRRSKVTLPLPDDWPPNFSYLESYVSIIKAEPDMAICCKFLFGVMLLTRCR